MGTRMRRTAGAVLAGVLLAGTAAGTATAESPSQEVVTAPAPVAVAGASQVVTSGTRVVLNGGASTGDRLTYVWTQTAGLTVTDLDVAPEVLTFDPPAEGLYAFRLTVTDSVGRTSSADVVVTVAPYLPAPVLAEAGPRQVDGAPGFTFALDGSASYGATSFAWQQLVDDHDPVVTLTNAYTPRATFVVPETERSLEFLLTVTGPGGTSTDVIEVHARAVAGSIVVKKAEYRPDKREWRIDGRANPGETVWIQLQLGNEDSTVTAVANSWGEWRYRVEDSAVPATGEWIAVWSESSPAATSVRLEIDD